jgi:hypothetical protein
MAFLSPWFLVGLLAVGLPLWLHRLERQAAERRPWASLAFFEPSSESSTRYRRYRYLALLACRLLLLSVLALLFARPALDARSALVPPGGGWHLIAVDTSLSMGHAGDWARAISEVERLLGGLSGEDRSQLVAFGPRVRVLGGPTPNHGSWRPLLRPLAPTAARGSYGELGEAVRALAQDQGVPLTLHVVSDFQRSAAPERFADLGLPAGATLVTHDVAAGPRPNWSIEGVAGRTRLHGQEAADLQVTIAGFATPAAVRRVELRVGARVVGSAEASVPASGRATARFTAFEVPRGRSRAELRLLPADDLTADDVFHVALERTDSVPALLVRGAADARAELYYRTALESAGGGTFELVTSTVEAAQTLSLERFAFVVLYDPPRLPPSLDERLRAFVEGGHSVLMIAGPEAARRRSLPFLAGTVADSGRAERPAHATPGASAHPIVTASEGLADVQFQRYLGADVPAERVLLRLEGGAPLLFEAALGAGRVLVVASPFDTAWNDWPVHASFVPFVLASARWLAGLEGAHTQATVGEVLDLGRGGAAAVASIEVIGPDGRRALGLAASVNERALSLDSAGFYEVRRAGRTEVVAVNPDPRESDLTSLEPEAIARWKATGGSRTERTAGPGKAPEGRELWPRLALLLAAAVLVESTLANRYLER